MNCHAPTSVVEAGVSPAAEPGRPARRGKSLLARGTSDWRINLSRPPMSPGGRMPPSTAGETPAATTGVCRVSTNLKIVGIDFRRLTRSHPSPLIPLPVEGRENPLICFAGATGSGSWSQCVRKTETPALIKEGTFAPDKLCGAASRFRAVSVLQTFGVLRTSYLGLRSSDSLQPRLANYGPSALKEEPS